MNIFDREPLFTFGTKQEATDFIKRIRDIAYKCDVVTINDILKDRGIKTCPEGYQFGYHRKDLKKITPVKFGFNWKVDFPVAGKMVRDIHGYWTVENALEATEKGGG